MGQAHDNCPPNRLEPTLSQPPEAERVPATRPDDGAGPAREPLARSAPGVRRHHVPGYEILEELGRGGMGVVYKARQIKADRLVALKMILTGDHAGARDRGRFQTEAEAVARLSHPHIVQVYEVGEHQGLPFFSMDLCTGGSLERRLRGTPLAPLQAAALVEQLAGAVEHAHEQGIIHRDL